VSRFSLPTRKSKFKTPVRLANGQRLPSSTICEISFELVRHVIERTFYVLRDLRAADLVLGFPWLDDEKIYLQFSTTLGFTHIDGTLVETQTEEHRP
jgi:hypothetical protein